MNQVVFVTGNGWRHDEAKRLLSGIDVHWARLTLEKPAGATSLAEIASGRVRDAWRQLGVPCFTENTGLFLDEHDGAPGAAFKRQFLELGEQGFAARYGGSAGHTRIALAYTADGQNVQCFEGQNAGRLLHEPRGRAGYGWDALWVPDGYQHTLAELASAKFLVNMRHVPFVELGAVLRGDGLDGIFEAHVTVAPCDEAAFAAVCDELGVKCLFIELPRGQTPLQPMTGSHHHGPFKAVQREVLELAAALVRRGFSVIRTKIEAVGAHAAIPKTDDAAKDLPSACYFEHHLKLGVPEGADLERAERQLRALNAHLSRNAKKPHERYVTVRAPFIGQATADAHFSKVEQLVRQLGFPVKNRVREYTVFDSGADVDRGWIG